MEDYKVLQTGDEIQEILNQAPVDTADIAELKEADTSLDGRLEAVEGKIPSGASSENPLTDKQYVDSSIASASATFRGTYNEVTDLELTTDATHADIGSALDEVIELADSNDYCFVQIPTDDETPMEIDSIERYKFVTGTGWEYEYTLNNSGFTAGQWAAINSGITSGLVTKLTDLPTNAELENLLNGKANATDVYTKSETYNKTELDSMITTPDVQYVSVTATAQTTAVTDVLPSTGAADTVYRVGSWDGTQYNANSYSEYAWNGSSYVLLNVKETGIATGSDFDNPTPAQRELVTTVGSVLDGISEGVFDLTAKTGDSYATLADALTAANTAIPTNKKRGGMSIKFVQSSDNKYVQYRLMLSTFSTVSFSDVNNWLQYNDSYVQNTYNADLNISDESGNTLIQCKGGHIKTKNFDSSKDATESERGLMSTNDKTKLNSIEQGAEVNDVEAENITSQQDLDLSDEYGNTLVRFQNGHIKTKNFDSSKAAEESHYESVVMQNFVMLKTGSYGDITTFPSLNLLHFSDIHAGTENLQRIVNFKNKYSTIIDDVLHTGDNVDNSWSDGFSFWSSVDGSEKIMNCIGNHDTRTTSPANWWGKTSAEAYARYFEPYIGNWGIEAGVNYNSGTCYYYKDYSSKKIRLIVLDGMHYDENQNTWFANVLADAITKGLYVVCADHFTPALATKTGNSFDSYMGYATDVNLNGQDWIPDSANGYRLAANVDTFINNGGHFICWLAGHTHRDFFSVLTAFPNQICINVPSANKDKGTTMDMFRGYEGIDCFNIVSINVSYKTLSIFRIGANCDSFGRHKGVIVWDFENNKMLFNN